jgi:hypothetical protein
MRNLWKFGPLVVCCLLAGVGCNQGALKYNNDAAGITKELEALGKEFGTQLPAVAGNPGKADELHKNIVSKANNVFQRGRALSPPDTKEGNDLHAAFISFLDTEEKIIKEDMGNMARMAGQGNLMGVQNFIMQVGQREQQKLNELRAAQERFAKANNFRLENK